MISLRFVLLATVFSSALANVVPPRFHRRRQDAPEGYRVFEAASADEQITLRIALTQHDFSGLEKAIYAASTPGSEMYGRYLTKDEVNSHISPSEEAVRSVSAWLAAHGLSSSSITPSGDWISVDATVSQASQLLQAEFSTFTHPDLDTGVTRTLGYSVPPEIKQHIVAIHPTIDFPVVGSTLSQPLREVSEDILQGDDKLSRANGESSIPDSCLYDPNADPPLYWKPWSAPCTHDLYEIPQKNITEFDEEGPLWLSSFNNQFANRQKLREYLEDWRPDLLAARVYNDVVSVTGGLNNQLPIDSSPVTTGQLRLVASLPVNTPVTFMTVGNERSDDPIDWFFDQADYLLNMDNPPSILIHHYSMLESEVEPDVARLLCNKYAQLAARGVSLIFPTSIGGVGGPWVGPSPRQCPLKFNVSFPASCPFITSVASTEIYINYWANPPIVVETVPTAMHGNNGGFSSLFERPEYQNTAATAYLEELGDEHSGKFDPAGRVIPDLALHQWVTTKDADAASGPAISTALLGSMIAMVNDELVKAGKPRLGFLNPFLYENSEIFRDFTNGNNPGCETDGFSAGVGWDPVTGLGAPMYPRLRAAAGL